MSLVSAREERATVPPSRAGRRRWDAVPMEAPSGRPGGAEPVEAHEVGGSGARESANPEPPTRHVRPPPGVNVQVVGRPWAPRAASMAWRCGARAVSTISWATWTAVSGRRCWMYQWSRGTAQKHLDVGPSRPSIPLLMLAREAWSHGLPGVTASIVRCGRWCKKESMRRPCRGSASMGGKSARASRSRS